MSTTCSVTLSRLQNIKRERKQKECQRKQKAAENRKHLANVRVVQKNLVFVVGLSQRLADPEVLKKHDYFGRFGKIHKVVINQSTSYAGSQVRGFFFIMSCYFYVKYICFILLSLCLSTISNCHNSQIFSEENKRGVLIICFSEFVLSTQSERKWSKFVIWSYERETTVEAASLVFFKSYCTDVLLWKAAQFLLTFMICGCLQGPSASAYVTYVRPEDALKAILAVNNVHVDGRTLKTSLGTTKYCSHFLRGSQCMKAVSTIPTGLCYYIRVCVLQKYFTH